MRQAYLQEKVTLLYPEEHSLPCLALTFTGNIASWKKKEGEQVGAGDEMAEIETDKATMAWESQDDGFIAKILLQEGAKDIPVGTPAMIFVEEEVRLCYATKDQSTSNTTNQLVHKSISESAICLWQHPTSGLFSQPISC